MFFVHYKKVKKSVLEDYLLFFVFISHFSLFSFPCDMQSMFGFTWPTRSITQSKNPLAHITDDQLAKSELEVMGYMNCFTKLLR